MIAGESSICDVDGKNGRLTYRGYDIHDLAQHTTFEEVIFLLWNGGLPTQAELTGMRADLDRARTLPAPALEFAAPVPPRGPGDGFAADGDLPAGPV